MQLLSHGLASVLIFRVLDIVFPNLFPPISHSWMLVAFFFGIFPDIDGFFAKDFSNHHKSPMHWPVLWLFFLILLLIFKSFLSQLVFSTLLLAFVLILIHIGLDYVAARTAGVQVEFPFSKKEMSLFPLHKSFGHFRPLKLTRAELIKYLNNYVKNKPLFLFEIFVIIAGLLAWIV